MGRKTYHKSVDSVLKKTAVRKRVRKRTPPPRRLAVGFGRLLLLTLGILGALGLWDGLERLPEVISGKGALSESAVPGNGPRRARRAHPAGIALNALGPAYGLRWLFR